MSAIQIINDCFSVGVTLKIEGQKVAFSAKTPPPKKQWEILLDHIRNNKSDILTELQKRDAVGVCHESSLTDATKRDLHQQPKAKNRAIRDAPANRETMHHQTGGQETAIIRQLEKWRGFIEALPPANKPEGAKLVKYALAFLDSPLSLKAVSLGWDSLSLFGVFNGDQRAAQRRHDTMGLVPSMAWSKIINPTLKNLELTIPEITIDKATFVFFNRGGLVGSRLNKQRILTGASFAVPFWENQYFMGGA